jgi:hypothetical protein
VGGTLTDRQGTHRAELYTTCCDPDAKLDTNLESDTHFDPYAQPDTDSDSDLHTDT